MNEVQAIVALQRATCDAIERLFSGGPTPAGGSVHGSGTVGEATPQKTADALPPPDGYLYWRCAECERKMATRDGPCGCEGSARAHASQDNCRRGGEDGRRYEVLANHGDNRGSGIFYAESTKKLWDELEFEIPRLGTRDTLAIRCLHGVVKAADGGQS